MASYQTRQREPLLEQSVQAMLERRARELLGLVLIGMAAMLAPPSLSSLLCAKSFLQFTNTSS